MVLQHPAEGLQVGPLGVGVKLLEAFQRELVLGLQTSDVAVAVLDRVHEGGHSGVGLFFFGGNAS